MFGNVYTCGGFVGDVDRIERSLETKTLQFYTRIAEQPDEACFSCSFSQFVWEGVGLKQVD